MRLKAACCASRHATAARAASLTVLTCVGAAPQLQHHHATPQLLPLHLLMYARTHKLNTIQSVRQIWHLPTSLLHQATLFDETTASTVDVC